VITTLMAVMFLIAVISAIRLLQQPGVGRAAARVE
jgi:hypothetical protein